MAALILRMAVAAVFGSWTVLLSCLVLLLVFSLAVTRVPFLNQIPGVEPRVLVSASDVCMAARRMWPPYLL